MIHKFFIWIKHFFENISFKNCTHFEIAFDYKEEKLSFEEQEEIEKDEENEIQNIFDETKISSFDVKIATFLDLNSSGNEFMLSTLLEVSDIYLN